MDISWHMSRIGPDEHKHDFTAVTSGGIYVGRIYRIDSGLQEGQWRWTFLLGHSQFRHGEMHGEEPTKQAAGDRVCKTYEAYLETPGSDGGGKSRIPIKVLDKASVIGVELKIVKV